MPRVLGVSQGGGSFLMSEVPLYTPNLKPPSNPQPQTQNTKHHTPYTKAQTTNTKPNAKSTPNAQVGDAVSEGEAVATALTDVPDHAAAVP